jgi:hypothetical protein
MATPQEIQKLLEDIQKQYDRLGKENPFANFDTSQFTDVNTAIGILNVGLRDARKEVQRLDSDLSGLVSGFDSMVDSIKNSTSGVRNTNKALEGMRGISQKIYYDQQGISKLNNKQLKQIQTQFKQKSKDLELSKSLLQTEIHQLKTLGALDAKQQKSLDQKEHALNTINEQTIDEASNQKELERRIEARIKLEKQYNEALGLGGAIIGSMKGALDKLGMSGLANKLGFNDALTEMEGLSQEIVNIENDISTLNTNNLSEKQLLAGFGGKHLKTLQEQRDALGGANSNLSVLKKGFSSMGASLIENLKDPLSIGLMLVGQLADAFGKVDKLTGETAKNLGMSYKEANNMVSDMTDIANLSGDAHINTENLVKSQLELSKALGINSQISGEILVDFTKLTEQAGFSSDAVTNLTKISQGTGKSLKENTAELLGQAKVFNINNGLALNEKELVEEIANTSSATVLTLGKSSKALVANVAAAKQFGINMEQAEGIASNLLNFQSSIESEMEAELLTGKQLNLEQARMLALKGETGKAAAEVLKQVGSSAEFGKMNVLAQESLATAMGMTRDQLAKSLIEREALANIGMEDLSAQDAYNELRKQGLSDDEIAKKLGDENLANQLKSESAQQRIAAITAKLQDLFMGLAEPIMAIVDPLLNLVTTVLPAINLLLQPIKTTFDGISKILTGDFENLSGMQAVLGGIAITTGTLLGFAQAKTALDERRAVLQTAELGRGAEILALMGLQNSAAAYQLAREEGKTIFQSLSIALGKTRLGQMITESGILTANSLKEKISLGFQAASAAIQQSKLGIMIAQGATFAYSIAKETVLLGIKVAQAAAAMVGVSAATLGIGTAIALAAAAGGIAYLYSISKPSPAGDMLSPADGKTQISTKEGGLFELSKNDDLVAAPGASKALKGGNTSPGASINIAPLVAQMSQMNATLNAILSKEGTITLDGTKVGTALTVSNSKLQ